MITQHELSAYCLSKAHTTEELPFDDVTLVYKVAGKIFAIAPSDNWGHVNIKCDPEEALERRAQYESVQPGYHMSKKHWVTVPLDGSVPRQTILAWIDDSYNLIVAGLPKTKRLEIQANMP